MPNLTVNFEFGKPLRGQTPQSMSMRRWTRLPPLSTLSTRS